jgi:C-terminal processing protease CtpA/Prc
MKNLLAIFSLLVFLMQAMAQTDCKCTENFQVLQQKVKNNYGGYDSRLTPKNKAVFEQLTDSIAQASATITDGYVCYELMNRWINFFKDGHLYLTTNLSPKNAPTEGVKMTAVDSTIFHQYLSKNKEKLDPVEGVWRNMEGSYTVAIKRDEMLGNAYIGSILKAKSTKWQVGAVKFTLKKEGEKWKVVYYTADFSTRNIKATLTENIIAFDQFGIWEKLYPEPKIKLDAEQFALDQICHFKMIDDKTAYLRLSSFNNGSEVIDSVINKNRAKILATPHLIIDIRGNGGGTNSSYKSVLPFMYTQPYVVEQKGGYIVASEDNIVAEKKMFKQFFGNLTDAEKKENAKDLADYQLMIDSMEMFKGSRFYFADAQPTKYDSVTTNPKKVAVLMNKDCASSAEWFILEAEFSKKVTLFGQNSAGIMDNTNVRQHKLACPSYTVGAASGRRGGASIREIDNVGFKPNVMISDAEDDWAKVVLAHWKKL